MSINIINENQCQSSSFLKISEMKIIACDIHSQMWHVHLTAISFKFILFIHIYLISEAIFFLYLKFHSNLIGLWI